MASTHNFFFLIAIIITMIVATASARSLANNVPSAAGSLRTTRSSLVARLKLEGEPEANCWDSLFELQACSGEVVMFFMNGETYLGHGCCQAIRVIGHDCWPNIMESLGFTNEEDDVLQGYCDEIAHNSPPSLLHHHHHDHPKVYVP